MGVKRPTIAVSTGPLWRVPLSDAFAAVHAAGGEAVEIMVTQNTETQSPEMLERLSSRYDLPVVAVHAPLLLLTRRVYTTDPLEKIRRTMELTRALGVEVVVVHPPYFWQVRYSLWLLHELEEAVAAAGTTITMENMYPVHVGQRRVGFHRFQTLGSLERFPHLTLDTSHLAVAGEDIVDAYGRLSQRVVHMHLSDNRGRGRDSHAPPGEGVLPIPDLLRIVDPTVLRTIVLEINPGPALDDRDELEAVLGRSVDMVRSNVPAPASDPTEP